MKGQNDRRKLIRWPDFLIIAGILIICIAALFFLYRNSGEETTAQISYNGKIVREIDLLSTKDEVFRLSENGRVSFEIKDHKIRFVDVDCPDKLCENVGFLSSPNRTAVCLPNRVTLKIIAVQADVDAVVN